ncbi:putative amine oxidase [copper-containing] [Gigantopelta aegis]|uniref:putative amine oxidase [copper-containing] n=1 Tax=Gigantopelta aegis TaxID=1735272 RepID=UPI001B8884F9|nr:putative amine oxidase [copper-containing] [Gigantopelta aegis]
MAEKKRNSDKDSVKSAARWRCVAGVLVLLSLGLLVAVIVLAVKKNENTQTDADSVIAKLKCKGGDSVIDTSEPENPGVFDGLTHKELKSIQEYIYGVSELNLARPKEAKINSSYLYGSDYFPPKKSEALQYLDRNGNKPAREARLIIFRGDKTPPIVEEYIVGPLPKPTYHKLLKSTARKNPVPYAHRPLGGVELGELFGHLYSVIDREVGYLLKDSYDATFTHCGKKCLTSFVSPVSSAILKKDVRKMWILAKYNIEYYSIQPVDIAFLANIDGSDSSKFYIETVVYADQVYSSLQALAAAYNSTSNPINKSKVEFPKYDENLFSAMFRRGPPSSSSSSNNPQRPAKSVEPDGKRYSIKHGEITFQGWKFNFRMSTLTGPQIYDVRFGGERIAYEIGLQEIAVFYSGQSAAQRAADYIDSGILVGTHADALVPDADCPESSTFLPTTFLSDTASDPVRKPKSVCIFEVDTGIPLRRHLSYSYAEGSFYSGLSDIVLTVRTILTLVNYDYVFDFVFHQSGALEIRTISTGYIISSFYTDKKGPYGFKIHDNMIGNIHHHMFHWKADVDVLGTSNRYETLDISDEDVNNTCRPDSRTSSTPRSGSTEV